MQQRFGSPSFGVCAPAGQAVRRPGGRVWTCMDKGCVGLVQVPARPGRSLKVSVVLYGKSCLFGPQRRLAA